MNMFKEIKIILFASSLLFCQSPDSLFVKGNNYYNNKDFTNAIKSYEDIIYQGLYHADLYFNLGNSYYNLEDYGNARWSYEMAFNLSPRNSDIIYNLDLTKRKIANLIEPPESSILYLINIFFSSFTYNNLIFFTSISILLSSIFFLLSRIRPIPLNRLIYYIFLSLFFVGLIMSINKFFWLKNNQFAIIISENADVYSAPYANENIKTFTLFSGNKTNVVQSTDKWIEISVLDGRKGWIKIKDVRTLD